MTHRRIFDSDRERERTRSHGTVQTNFTKSFPFVLPVPPPLSLSPPTVPTRDYSTAGLMDYFWVVTLFTALGFVDNLQVYGEFARGKAGRGVRAGATLYREGGRGQRGAGLKLTSIYCSM